MKPISIRVEGTVTHQEIKEAMNGFIRLRDPEKLTIVVMDNASVHRKAVEEVGWEWLGWNHARELIMLQIGNNRPGHCMKGCWKR